MESIGSLDDLLWQGPGKHSAIAKRVLVDEYPNRSQSVEQI
jgi:hypothetical protein